MANQLLAKITFSFLRIFNRVEVKGLEHLRGAGERVIIAANHCSALDGQLIAQYVPGTVEVIENVDASHPLALRGLVEKIEAGKILATFPEGRLTTTGGLMKIYEWPVAITEMAKARVVPLRIDGPQFSHFSLLQGVLPLRWFAKITLTFMPPVGFTSPLEKQGSALREHHSEQLYLAMSAMMFKTANIDRSLWQTLLDAAKTYGKGRLILEDIQRAPISYSRLIMGSLVLGRKLAALLGLQKNVGVLLPNAQAMVMTFFGLMAQGKVPAMMNFSTGATNMLAACTAAELRTIITSRKFIEVAEMQATIAALSQVCKIIYLEDVRSSIGLGDKLYGLFGKFFPKAASRSATHDANSPAVILFTSGSEGVPKGVVLSHRNLNANWNQGAARVDFNPTDIVFNTLPTFHAFGLLGGLLLPLLSGLRSFQYPSPLHYKIIPELCYATGATVLFGTDTFFAGYARAAHGFDFHKLRLVVAGAERLKPETAQLWLEKFGKRILEGYGVTETAPALAINTPTHYKPGTVGQMFDDVAWRIEPVPGIERGGRLFVRGPNVMLGYLRADNPGAIEAPPGGWHDTGDIVEMDALNYVTILGRAKRFAKIAGEMVSLTAVEAMLQKAFPDAPQAVVAVPDRKKGEQLVLITTLAKLERKALADGLKQHGATELMLPKTIIAVEALPLLGSGKTDYVYLNRLALERVEG